MGTLQTNPETLPDTVTNSWQPLIQRDALGYAGMNKITLTNWDSGTTKPLVAQGSIIDIDGSLAVFALDEAITDVAAGGMVYLKFVVSGSTVTPEFTAEAPAWYADKAGWYNVAGERFSGHLMTKAGTAYSDKRRWRDESDGEQLAILANTGIDTNNIDASSAVLGPTTVNGQITVNGEVQGTSLDINGSGNVSGTLSVSTLANVQKLLIQASGMSGTYGTLVVNGSIVIPAGCYMIASADDTSGSDKVYLQVYTGSAWEGDLSGGANDYWWPGGLVMSDGANYRFASSGGAVTLHYRKIW